MHPWYTDVLLPIEQMHTAVGWSGDIPEEWEDFDLIRSGLTWRDISGQDGPLPWYVRRTFVMFRRIEREAAAEAASKG